MNKIAVVLILLVACYACGKAGVKSEEELVIGDYQNQIKSLELPECDKAMKGNEMDFLGYMQKVDRKYIKEIGLDEIRFAGLLDKHMNTPAVMKAEEEFKKAAGIKISKMNKQR